MDLAMALNSVVMRDGGLPLLETKSKFITAWTTTSFFWRKYGVLSCYTVLHSCERNKEEEMLPPSQHVQNNFESWTYEWKIPSFVICLNNDCFKGGGGKGPLLNTGRDVFCDLGSHWKEVVYFIYTTWQEQFERSNRMLFLAYWSFII